MPFAGQCIVPELQCSRTWVALLLLLFSAQLRFAAEEFEVSCIEGCIKAAAKDSSVNQLPATSLSRECLPNFRKIKECRGSRLALRQLSTTARLMQTVAHPDDEDGGMLTLEARGRGANVLLMTLNRGEGGQNKIGSNLSDVLGVLRTEELLAADEYYGVQERFSRVADFGFSKNPEETFAKWGGHEVALGDMVRVIRTFRPDVLVARFSGTDRDGHGHHQASSILTQEAFRAAADPKRFPEQIAQGLLPWQAQKLYIGNVCGFGASTCEDGKWTIKLNTGEKSGDLGKSYAQFAMEGLRHQLSQGSGTWTVDPGDRFTFYKLVDSIKPAKLDEKGHEKDFFDGIDPSLPALGRGIDKSKFPKFEGEIAADHDQDWKSRRCGEAE